MDVLDCSHNTKVKIVEIVTSVAFYLIYGSDHQLFKTSVSPPHRELYKLTSIHDLVNLAISSSLQIRHLN